MARWSRRAAVTLAVALAGGAQACELACQKLVSPVQVDSHGPCAPEPGRWEGLKQLGTSTSDEAAEGIAILPSGRLYVAGWTNGALESAPVGAFDGFLAAIDRDGDLLRLRQYPSFDSIWRLRASPDETLVGLAAVEVAGGTDLQAVKLGPHGEVIWATGLPGELSDAHDLAVDPDGAVYVTGSTALDDSTVARLYPSRSIYVATRAHEKADWVIERE